MARLKFGIVAFGMTACLVGAPAAASALSLTIGDAYFLGYVDDGIPASEAAEVTYINSLLLLSAGAAPTDCALALTEKCDRSASTLDATGFPSAVVTDAVKDETGNNLGIDVTNWTYVLGKYDGPNFGSLVWYVADIDGLVDLPAGAGENKKGEPYALSHFTLFNFTGDPDPDPIPEPASLLLVGLGLLGAGAVRRRVRQ